MRTWILALVGACASSPGEIVTPRDPTERGPHGDVFEDVEIDLGTRSEGFPMRIQARVHGPESYGDVATVILFNHGFATETEAYFRLGAHLASWGHVVVMPQWDLGVNSRTHADLAVDAIAALDWLQQNPLPFTEYAIDVTGFGIGGHSRGGKQALLTALADDRVKALFNLDPVDALPPFGEVDPADYPSTAPELVGELTIPWGQIGAGRGPEGVVPCAPAEEGFAAIFAAAPAGTLQFELPTAGHQDFTDACSDGTGDVTCNVCPAGDDPAASNLFARATLTAFFGKRLRGDDGFDGWLEEEDPIEVVPDFVRTVK